MVNQIVDWFHHFRALMISIVLEVAPFDYFVLSPCGERILSFRSDKHFYILSAELLLDLCEDSETERCLTS